MREHPPVKVAGGLGGSFGGSGLSKYPFRNSNLCKSTEHRIFGSQEHIQTPHSVGPPWVGGLPNSRSTTCGGHYLLES